MAPAEPFKTVLNRLRAERGMTIEDIGLEVRQLAAKRGIATDRTGASFSSFQKHAAGTAKASPSLVLMELVADALDVQPAEFAEYRLASARTLLDEREVGLDEALATFSQIAGALQTAAASRAQAASRRARSPKRTSADPPAAAKRRANDKRRNA